MHDVKFLQHYNEVAQENFVVVVKQNILFQAQIKALSEQVNRIPEFEKAVEDFELLKSQNEKLREENVSLLNQLNSKISLIENAGKSDAERFRLQTAVNTGMKEIAAYKEAAISMQNKLNEQSEYIAKLEDMLPKTAKKKLGLFSKEEVTEENAEESTVDNEPETTLSNGGSF
jgi:hypothetical protein